MQPQFLRSYFHTPAEFAQTAFVHVLRAGHLQAAPGYRVERRFCVGHDLIYCASGKGYVRLNGKEHVILPSEVVWIDGRNPHGHWADPQNPWNVLWIRADGFTLSQSAEALNVRQRPVFSLRADIADQFKTVLDHLSQPPLAIDALLHADLSLILSGLFEERLSVTGPSYGEDVASAELKSVMENMSVYFYRRWTVGELARMANMSETGFYRCFHRAAGSSPMSWIRRQRMSHAKRRLVETTDSIKQIAEQVGYADPFFFSRDFKRACGVSPKRYREQERHDHK